MIAQDAPLTAGARQARVVRLRTGMRSEAVDWLTEEVPVALEFNGISHAVMLATPMDLEDFALGFGLSEGIFDRPADLYDCEVDACAEGLTVHMEVSSRSFARLRARRRTLAGRTGCGLCGTESLAQVLRPLPRVASRQTIQSAAITRAMDGMRDRQLLGQATGATHAAAWCGSTGEIRLLREDVGRHNALDKLIGALARAGIDAGSGFMAVTSRASVEMVHKAVVAGVPLLAAVSAPTLLAVNTAEQAGMCLVGLARQGNLVVYAHPQHLSLGNEIDL
ncbi:MAG: formate dehydrogenase accessory sulfurtransferase FdhD [Thiomonas sp.]|uniref:Formate dehydrogenase, subunit FdhD n=1 Tax=mine drainage metagenome TaxID=410659 RepID=E6PKX8_9ZZZZ